MTTEAPSRLDEALDALRADIATCHAIEAGLRGKSVDPNGKSKASRVAKRDACRKRDLGDVLEQCLSACAASRKRFKEDEYVKTDLSDHALSQLSRFTKGIALEPFAQFLHYVPRLVNVRSRSPPFPAQTDGVFVDCRWSHWPRPCPCRARASRCRWTCGTSPRAARAPSTRPSALRYAYF